MHGQQNIKILSLSLLHISNKQDDQARQVGRNSETAVYSKVFFLEIPGDNEQNDEKHWSGLPFIPADIKRGGFPNTGPGYCH